MVYIINPGSGVKSVLYRQDPYVMVSFYLGNDILLDEMNLSYVVYLEFNGWIDSKTFEIEFNGDDSFSYDGVRVEGKPICLHICD